MLAEGGRVHGHGDHDHHEDLRGFRPSWEQTQGQGQRLLEEELGPPQVRLQLAQGLAQQQQERRRQQEGQEGEGVPEAEEAAAQERPRRRELAQEQVQPEGEGAGEGPQQPGQPRQQGEQAPLLVWVRLAWGAYKGSPWPIRSYGRGRDKEPRQQAQRHAAGKAEHSALIREHRQRKFSHMEKGKSI